MLMLNAEEDLKKILSCFFVGFDGHLQWSYIEGTSLAEIYGVEFEQELLPYLDETAKAEYEIFKLL